MIIPSFTVPVEYIRQKTVTENKTDESAMAASYLITRVFHDKSGKILIA